MTAAAEPTTTEAGFIKPQQSNLVLIPWDPQSPEHVKRMFQQRVACKWDSDQVAGWQESAKEGVKWFYWITVADSSPNKDEMLSKHMQDCPEEREPLFDTAVAIGKVTRTPANTPFMPVGHFALVRYPDRDSVFGLDQGVIWLKSLYISRPLQTYGLGRQTMSVVENWAPKAPFNSKYLAIDTASAESHTDEDFLYVNYDLEGLPRPKVNRTNQEWYSRQGYQIMPIPEEDHPAIHRGWQWKHPETGKMLMTWTVYMVKKLE